MPGVGGESCLGVLRRSDRNFGPAAGYKHTLALTAAPQISPLCKTRCASGHHGVYTKYLPHPPRSQCSATDLDTLQ